MPGKVVFSDRWGSYLDKIAETIRSRLKENSRNGFIHNTSSFMSKIEIKL